MPSKTRIIKVLNRIQRNAGGIFVWEQINGQWERHSLIDLPPELAVKHTCRLALEELASTPTEYHGLLNLLARRVAIDAKS